MTLAELHDEVTRLSRLVDEAITAMFAAAERHATAEDAYRMARATGFLKSKGTVAARNAQVDVDTSPLRVEAHLAEGLLRASFEVVRARKAQLSAAQSLLSAHRAEAEIAKYGSGS